MADFNFFLNRQGVRGNKGEQGEQGYSPRITVKTETASEYVLNVQNEDGSFDTPNLRGNAIENLGGTYIRFNQDTEQMYTGYADTASTTSQGEVTLSTYEDLASGGDESEVTTSKDVHDFVEAKISEASVNYVDIDDYTQKMSELDGEISDLDNNKLDFTGLANTLAAGTNITITPNTSTGKITIAGEPVSQAQADWNQTDTDAPDYIKNKPVIDDELSSTSTNAVQNRLVTNAINLISNEFENYATNKLDNLSNEGEARLHALKAYSDNGEVLTDAEGLANVKRYAHSTFDLSKFTTVGSPVITDDGIASGFSGSNYLNPTFDFNTLATKDNWEFDVCITTNNLTSLETYNYIYATSGTSLSSFNINSSKKLVFFMRGTDTLELQSNTILQANTTYYVKFVKNGTKYQILLSSDGINYIVDRETTSNAVFNPQGTWTIGASTQSGYARPFPGSIDLKQFSITVDGVEVFSGNKTGIDTIKPDDYTVVGTPTISADGIYLTGYGRTTSNDKITFSNTFDLTSNEQVFECMAYIEPLPTDYGYSSQNEEIFTIRDDANVNFIRIMRAGLTTGTNYVILEQRMNSAYAGNSYNTRWILGASFNGWVKFKIYYDALTQCYKCDCYTCNNGIENFVTTMICEYTGEPILGENYHVYFTHAQYENYGKIDLNSVHCYINGNLVYQPCLKIPYTESKTGSKVVNSVYRGRVNDMASQFGYANYYTLDEDNENFTLPQVELYGLIEKAASTVPSGVVQSSTISNIVSLTQAEYDALTTKDANTFYVITPST